MQDSTEAGPANSPGSEARGERRLALLLRASKLIVDDREFLCVLRDASAGGIKARLFHDLPQAARFELELSNGARFCLQPVWQRDGHAGFRFASGPIDLRSLVDEASDFPKRQLRLKLDHPIRIAIDAVERDASLADISQHGARITTTPPLAIGQRLQVTGKGLPPSEAIVRWRRRDSHGLVFQRGFRLDELARLMDELQSPAPIKQKAIG
jgi:hypothetical protein